MSTLRHLQLRLALVCLLPLTFIDISKAGNILQTTVIGGVSNIGMHEKIEFGIAIDNVYLPPNCYDPDIVRIQAIFTSPSNKTHVVEAFYMEEYTEVWDARGANGPSWTKISVNPFPWRARFSPDETGEWSVHFTLYEYAEFQDLSSTTPFNCVASNHFGFLEVSQNGRYLHYRSDSSSFFGIPTQLAVPNTTAHAEENLNYLATRIPQFESHGGNTIRIIPALQSLAIEDAAVGIYNTSKAFEMDRIVEICDANEVHMLFIIQAPDEFKPSSTWGSWSDNPYEALPSVTHWYEFFSDVTAKKHFKNKLRYVHSRWGYSPVIMAYEIMNEPEILDGDWKDYNGTNVGLLDQTYFTTWVNEMSAYLHTMYPRPLTSIALTSGGSLQPGKTDAWTDLDINNGHLYPNGRLAEYGKNYVVRSLGRTEASRKPALLSEYAYTPAGQCYASEANDVELHNGVWSGVFGGGLSSHFYFFSSSKFYHQTWYNPAPARNWLTIKKFLQGENFNEASDYFTPISDMRFNIDYYNNNTSYTDLFGVEQTPDMEFCDSSGYTGGANASSYDFHTDDIETDLPEDLQVFGLKKSQRVLGWVHNKNFYWFNFNLHPTGPLYGFGPEDKCFTCQVDYLGQSFTRVIDPISSQEANVTLRDLRCDGLYDLEWWSTWPENDIDGDGQADHGGLISTQTVSSTNGEITFPILDMDMPEGINLNRDPSLPDYTSHDYAFKLIFKGDNGNNNERYLHDRTDKFDFGGSHTITSSGQMCETANGIFYAGTNGFLQRFYWNTSTIQWKHDGLVPNWSTQNSDFKVKPASQIVSDASTGTVFYVGKDNRLQHYWLNSGAWLHDYTDQFFQSPDVQASGEMAISSNGIFYRGTNGYLQRAYWDGTANQWAHDGLVANWTSQNINFKIKSGSSILVDDTGNNVFYVGADNRVQHYTKSGSVWFHDYTDKFFYSPSIEASGEMVFSQDGIFYRGSNGFVQRLYWNSSTNQWTHDGLVANWLNQSSDFKMIAGGDIVVAQNGTVFYIGIDNRLQHYFESGGTYYVHDRTDKFFYTVDVKASGRLVLKNDELFYSGLNAYVQRCYWDPSINQWSHDGLVDNWTSQPVDHRIHGSSDLLVADNGSIFYTGNDQRVQHYWKDNPCIVTGGISGKRQLSPNDNKTPIGDIQSTRLRVNDGITYYPTPASEYLTIEWIGNWDYNIENLNVQLIDVSERSVYTDSTVDLIDGKGSLNLRTFEKGIYLINFYHAGALLHSGKLIIK